MTSEFGAVVDKYVSPRMEELTGRWQNDDMEVEGKLFCSDLILNFPSSLNFNVSYLQILFFLFYKTFVSECISA